MKGLPARDPAIARPRGWGRDQGGEGELGSRAARGGSGIGGPATRLSGAVGSKACHLASQLRCSRPSAPPPHPPDARNPAAHRPPGPLACQRVRGAYPPAGAGFSKGQIPATRPCRAAG